MSTVDIIRTIIEFCMVLIVIYCFVKEEKIIRFEQRFFPKVKKKLKKIRRNICSRLKKNERFMAWLNRPSLSEQIADSFPPLGITVWSGWRNHYE